MRVPSPRRRSAAALVVLAALGTLSLAGCGGDATAAASRGDGPAASALPLVTPGTLTVATDATFAPMESTDGSTFTGADIDLVTDLAQRLGLRVVFVQKDFGDLIDVVGAHRVDLVVSSMTDRAERQQKVDFVDYFVAGSQALTRAGNPLDLAGPETWCGRTVAVSSESTNGDLVGAQSVLCEAAGKPGITRVDVPNGASGEQVSAGAADLGVEDYPAAAVLVADSSGVLDLAGQPLQAAPYGLAIAKDRTVLLDALQVALQESIADGRYDKILATYDLQAAALRTTAINGGA